MKYKICIWENIPSPHHRAFFRELYRHPNIDLQIRYFENFHNERIADGWDECLELPVEKYILSFDDIYQIDDFENRVHIVPGNSTFFTKKLIQLLINKNIKWIHWSERGGISLAKKLNFNPFLFNALYPFFAKVTKKKYASLINKHAEFALGQGYLAEKSFLEWGVKKKKINYLFYTIDEKILQNQNFSDLNKNKKVFLYVGRISKGKGINILLQAFAKIIENNKNWELWLVGREEKPKFYQKKINKMKLNEYIRFFGPQKMENIGSFLKMGDVFVFPTLFDGWGAALLEAAYFGKPLISTTQCGSSYHLIQNDINGYLIKAGSVKELYRSMMKYINNEKLISEHGKKSKEIYNEYSPEKNVERLLNILKVVYEK